MTDIMGARAGASRPRGVHDAGGLEVLAAPPLLTVQDEGRALGRSMGVPRSGAMDLVALRATNALVGNATGTAALEWAGGGGRLRVRRPLLLAIGGAHAELRLGGRTIPWGVTIRAKPGDVLEIAAPHWGRWLYLAVSGGMAVPELLGSRSTYTPAALGGFEGRTLARGDLLPVGLHDCSPASPRDAFDLREAMTDILSRQQVRVRSAPSAPEFASGAWSGLLSQTMTVLPASDRMGTRLALSRGKASGPSGEDALDASLAGRASEPACIGLVQIPPDGQPLVIMPDGPTLGGYPALACVRSEDIAAFAQRAPGERVRLLER